jgi:hypothetical protein
MPGLRLILVLNPSDKNDMRFDVLALRGGRVFMRIFAINESDVPVAFDHLSAEIYSNHGGANILALAPSDCPHAGDLADKAEKAVCAVTLGVARSGGLKNDGDPSNGSQLGLVQTLMPGQQVGGFALGTGKAGLVAEGRPFVLQPGEMVHLADGRTRETGMIASAVGSTPVIALGFASIKGLPITVTPAYATATVVDPQPATAAPLNVGGSQG